MPRKILIVEDDGPTAMIIAEALKKEFKGYLIQIVGKLSEARAIVNSVGPPSVVILDLTLLDSNREQTLEHLNEIKAICPVAIVTGHSAEEIRSRAHAQDVPVYEKASVTEPNLLTKVVQFAVQVLGPKRLDDSISRAERLLESPPPYHDAG